MQARRLRSLQALGIFCGFAAGAWLGGAEAPIKLLNPDISPITVSLIMVCGVFLARWSVPAFIRGTSHVSADVRQAPHLVVWAVLAGCMWAVANTLTIYAIRNVGRASLFRSGMRTAYWEFFGESFSSRITFRSLEALARGFRRRSIDVRGQQRCSPSPHPTRPLREPQPSGSQRLSAPEFFGGRCTSPTAKPI